MKGAEQMLEKAMTLQKELPPDNPHRAKVHYFYALDPKGVRKNMMTRLNTCGQLPSNFPRDRRDFSTRSAGCSTSSGSMKQHSQSFRKR